MKRFILAALLAASPLATAQTPSADPFVLTCPLTCQAVFSCDDVQINGLTDSAGSVPETAHQGHILSNGRITVNGTGVIDGNATAGPGKTVLVNGNGRVTGTKGVAAVAASCAPIDLVALAADLKTHNDNATIPKSTKGKDLLGGPGGTEFVLNGNDFVTLPSGTYYFTKFTLNGNSTLDIAGAVRILCTGDATFNGDANVSTAHTPFDFRFFTSGTSLQIGGGISVGGFFYAPNAPATVAGNGRILGGLFAKSVTINGNGRVTRQADLTPPTVSISEPLDGSTSANLAAVIVRGAATDADSPVTVTVNGAAVPVAANGSFTTTLDLRAPSSPVITAIATDAVGHTATATVTLGVQADTRQPTLTLDSPALAPGSCLAAGIPVLVSGKLGDSGPAASPVRSVTLSVSPAGAGPRSYTATFDTTGRVWSVPNVDVGAVDGTLLVSVTGTGANGQVSRIARTFRVKASSPSVRILLDGGTFPGSGAGVPPANAPAALLGRAVVPRTLVADGPGAAPPAATLTLDGAAFLEGSAISSEGTHLLVARAVDCAGHEGLAYARFTLDLTPPRLLSTSPADGAVSGVAVTTFSGTADRSLATALVNGLPAQVSGTSFTLSPFPWREGANAVTIELTSLAGNRATYTRSFTARTLALRLDILESGLPLVSGTRFFRAVVPVLRASDAQATVTATLNGAPFTSGTSVDTTGDYTLSATATDSLLRSVSASVTFRVDRTAGPQIDITSPADGAIVSGPAIPVSGTNSPSVVGVTVNGRAAALTGTTFSLADLAVPFEGIYEITAVAVDGTGRTASATRQVSVRGPAPRIVVTEPVDGRVTNRTKIDVAGAVAGGPSATADGSVNVAGIRIPLDASGGFRARDVAVVDGPNVYTVSAVDSAGRTGSMSVRVTGKTTPPSIRITADGQPLADGATFSSPVTIRVETLDPIAAPPVPNVRLNGQPQAATSSAIDLPIRDSGGYALAVAARDAAGNETRATRSFTLSAGGCTLADLDPPDGSSIAESRVTLRGRSDDAASVAVRVPDGSGGSTTYPARLADGTFAVGDLPLPVTGPNRLSIDCTDRGGATKTTALTLVRLAAGAGPVVHISSPSPGSKTSQTAVTVSGTVSDSAARVTVNGVSAPVSPAVGGGTFSLAPVTLAEGPNVLTARAVDPASRTGEDRAVVYRDTAAPKVQITSPASGAHLGPAGSASPSVVVTGLVDLTTEPNLASVVVTSPVGSVTATVDMQTGAFRALAVPLQPGPASSAQTITATATDTLGQAGTSSVSVTFDPAGPALVLAEPADLARYTEASPPTFRVSGEAWAADGAQISVNGGALDPATLSWGAAASDGRRHTTFTADVTLPSADGGFAVIVRVEDPAGNYATAKRLLFRETAAPTVVEMQPPDGTAQAEPDEIPLVLFSKPILPSSLAAADGLTLTRLATGEKIAATTTVAGNAVALVPGSSLLRGERYRFRAGAQVTDLAGHPLAAAEESLFTVATAPTAPPTLDTLPAVVCARELSVTGKASAFATVRVRLGSLAFTGSSDSAGRFRVAVPLPGSGYFNLHVAALDRDGTSASPETTALVRVDCSAPTVSGAAFDRTTGRLTISFSEAMNPATLTVGGSGAAMRVSDAADEARTAQAATLSLSSDGILATLDLGAAADSWWRTKSVRLEVGAPAADAFGNALGARFETVFFVSGGADPSGGFLAGEAYDDETGRPLAGADAKLYSSSAVLPLSAAPASVSAPIASATTDGRGRFSLVGDVAAGRYALVLSRAGYTRAVRRFPLEPATGVVPFDARLAPLAAISGTLNVAAGGSFSGPSGSGMTLDVGTNALSGTNLDVRITLLSGQALPELFPLGWSPLAAADVRLESAGAPLPEGPATPFVLNAVRLMLPLPAETPPAATLFAVRYDAASGLWLTLPPPDRTTAPSGAPLARVSLTGPGTVSVVLPDDAPSGPSPLPSAPETQLPGVSLPSPVPALSATIALDPPVVAPSGRAAARVVAKSADGSSAWPSGLAVRAYLDEKLVLSGGGELYEAPFAADLVLYRAPLSTVDRGSAPPSAAGTMTFRVSPSPKAAQVLLETGFENIRLYPFPEQLERGGVLGPAGGSIVSSDGVELELPEGALVDRIVAGARFLTASELTSLPVPAGYTLVAAVRLDLSGRTLDRAATVRILTPAGLAVDPSEDSRLILARLVESPSDGRGAFARLVARVSRTAPVGGNPSKLVAAPEGPASALPLAGLVTEGVHLFLRATASIGFATGFVRGAGGLGVEGSRVTAAGLGTADLSLVGGRYAVVAPAGAVSLTALHPQTNESGSAQIPALAKGDVASVDIVIRPIPPAISSVQPANGAVDQPPGSVATVTFDQALDPASVGTGVLTLGLADASGNPTGLSFNGSVSLSPDRRTLVFTPTRPLPPGIRCVASLAGLVRSAAGTPYAGALPYRWRFTVSRVLVPGGQVHPEKIRLVIPAGGTAQVIGADGALPTVPSGTPPWSVWFDVDGAPACPTVVTTPANGAGGFTATSGCPPTAPITTSSAVYIHILDSTGGEAATWKLGPFVTADGKGFVAPAGVETVYTTTEGIEVTVPAAAFAKETLVTIRMRPTDVLGVPAPAGLEIGAVVDVDFDGVAGETLRLRIPVQTTAPAGRLVVAASAVDLPWGRRLRLLDLGRLVADGSGNKFISTVPFDQPAESLASSPRMALATTPTAPTGCRTAICSLLIELRLRETAGFFYGVSVELSAVSGSIAPALLVSQFAALYNTAADAFVFMAPPFDWNGGFVLPSVGGNFSIVRRDQATGWILGETAISGIAADPSRLTSLGTIATGPSDPPRLLDATPFSLTFFKAPDVPNSQTEENVRLRLEVESHTEASGATSLRSVADFPLAESSWIELYDLGPKSPGQSRAQVASGQFGTPPLATKAGDDLLAVVSPGGLDPESLDVLTFDFSRPLLAKTNPSSYLKLTDCGPVASLSPGATPACNSPSKVSVEVTQTRNLSRLEGRPVGVLGYGHQFRLELNGIASGADPKKDLYPATDPSTFYFATRPIGGTPIGSTDPSSGVSSARDLMKFGNILLVGGIDGKIVAYDVTNPTAPRPFASGGAGTGDAVRAFAADGHGRLFFASRVGSTWAVRALRIEDVRNATATANFVPAPGGVKVSLAPDATTDLTPDEYLSIVGTFPSGIPTGLDLVVKDDTLGPWELKTFYEGLSGRALSDSTPDSTGFYSLLLTVSTKDHLAKGSAGTCSEPDVVHTQRVTIDNLTTGQSWSVDVVNVPTAGSTPVTFRARRGDQLQVRYNLSAIGYVAIVGSGVSAVDLNRFYDNPLSTVSGVSAAHGDQCGRRLGTVEGREITSVPSCQGAPTQDPWTPPLAWTPAVAALGGPGDQIWVYGVLTRFGASVISALASTPGAMNVVDLHCLRALVDASQPTPTFRSVVSAIGVSWTDRGIEAVPPKFVRPASAATPRTVKGDLLFFSLGPAGIGVFDVTSERRGEVRLIGRFQAKGHSIFRLQVDLTRNRLYAGGTDADGNPVIDVWDILGANGGPWPDGVTPTSGPLDPDDRRLVLSLPAAWDADHIALDPGTGLLFTWDNGLPKGLVIPVDDPRFLFPGRFSDGARLSSAPLAPLGVPLRRSASDETTNREADERNYTAAFKVRVALPGFLGETLKAKVETLRGLPDESLLAKPDLGLLSAMPGGPGWPDREVFVTLRRLVPAPTVPAATYDSPYNLYESDETVLLLADPRARKDYQRQTIPGETADETHQCRRCDLPSFLDSKDPSLKELLAGGPYVRAFLAVPPGGDTNTQQALALFAALAGRERAPTGTAPVAAWADSIPSPVQAALAEPAQNAAFWNGEAGARVSLVSGEAILEATDHAVAGRGVGFVFDRTYRSGALGYGPLGAAGWESSLFGRLRIVPLLAEEGAPTIVEFHDGAGRVWSFLPANAPGSCPDGWEADGLRCVPKGLQLRLEELPSGSGFRLLSRNNDAMTFDAAGRLTSISDRQRRKPPDPPDRVNTLHLYYDAGGFAVRAEDEYGRVYKLRYDESPKLSTGLPNPGFRLLQEIVDFAGRKVGFRFDDRRRLTEVHLPEIRTSIDDKYKASDPVVTYRYASDLLAETAAPHGSDFSSLKLAGYRQPGGSVDRIAFEYRLETGRVKTVSVPPHSTSASWEFQSAFPSTAAPITSIAILSPLLPTKLTTRYTIEKGRITKREDLSVETLADGDSTPAAGDPIPTASLVTKSEYENDGRLARTVWPDGSETTTQYPGSGDRIIRANPESVSEPQGSGPVGTLPVGTTKPDTPVTALSSYVDNIPEAATDPVSRVARQAVALSQESRASGYSAEGNQPEIKGTSEFDAFGRLKKLTGDGANGSLTVVGYGSDMRGRADAGFVSEIARGDAGKETLEYDDNTGSGRGNVTRRTTGFKTWTEILYDEWDRPIRETSGQSDGSAVVAVADAVTERAYDAAGRLVLARRKQKNISGDRVETSYRYNDRDEVIATSVTPLAGGVPGASLMPGTTNYTYDEAGKLTDVLTPGQMRIQYTYDHAGRVQSDRTGTAATSGVRRRGYDPMGRIVFTTDGDVGIWRGKFDAWGRLYREELPTGAVVEREYDAAGGLKRETTWDRAPGSAATKLAESLFHVTAAGKVDRIQTFLTPAPETYRLTMKTYDASGRLVFVTSGPTDSLQRKDLLVEYDKADRPTKETDAAGNEVRHDYGGTVPWPLVTTRLEKVPGLAGPVETVQSRFRRDAFGRVVQEDRTSLGSPLSTVLIELDQAGNVLRTQTAGGGSLTSYQYDGLGRLLSVTRPSGGTSKYGYDLDGRLLVRETSRVGATLDRTAWTYEDGGTGRLASIARPDGTTESYKYNADDTVDFRTMRSGVQVKYLWDPANRLTARYPVSQTQSSNSRVPRVDGGDTYDFDPASRLLSARRRSGVGSGGYVESPAAAVAYASYDTGGRPGLETVGSRGPLKRAFDTWSREAALELPSGVGSHAAGFSYQRGFDALDRVLSVQGGGVSSLGSSLGATWEWGGTSRLWGVTTMGTLKTAHRYGYPGSGFGTFPTRLAPWKLGSLSVGAASDPARTVTDPIPSTWGTFFYGYRSDNEARQGRQAKDLGAGAGHFSGQGWAWGLDNALRLARAEPGPGSTDGIGGAPSSDAFGFVFGQEDQLLSITRDATNAPSASYTAREEGRIDTREGATFSYDLEGNRVSDDRFLFTWGWRGELLAVEVKDSSSPYAGQKIFFEYDALGRLLARTHAGTLPSGGTECTTYTSACARPFIERRRYLWGGATHLSEAAYAADQPDGSEGPIRWRKSYVPGASGLDDAVQVRVEVYDGAGATVASDRTFAYLRDEQGTVLGLVEEKAGADPQKPPTPVRYLYTPFGEAHAEVGPEVRAVRFDAGLLTITKPDGTAASQTPGTAAPGAIRLTLSVPLNLSTLSSGIMAERRQMDGSWSALTSSQLAIGRSPSIPEEIQILPLSGWDKDATYRVRLTTTLRDALGRSPDPAGQPSLEMYVPSSAAIVHDRSFPLIYDSALASGQTATGTFPGGQPHLFQGAWTDPVTGLQYNRARWYDARNASWLSEDPLGPLDSPNLYGYVGLRPHEKTDPLGLAVPVPPGMYDAVEQGQFAKEDWRYLKWLAGAPAQLITDTSYRREFLATTGSLIKHGLGWVFDRPEWDVANIGMTGIIKIPSTVAQLPKTARAVEKVLEEVSQGEKVLNEAGGIPRSAAGVAKSGETVNTAIGRAAHSRFESERAIDKAWDVVNETMRDAAGEPVNVPRRVDLRTGAPVAEKGTQTVRPDAVSFSYQIVLDDKPLTRSIVKDRQEIIRNMEAYRTRTGNLPKRVAIQRYDPATGQPVQTDIFSPEFFIPKQNP